MELSELIIFALVLVVITALVIGAHSKHVKYSERKAARLVEEVYMDGTVRYCVQVYEEGYGWLHEVILPKGASLSDAKAVLEKTRKLRLARLLASQTVID